MSQPSPEQFRKSLIAELASTRWPRKIAIYGSNEKDVNLAVRLGVQEDVLTDAIELVRFGFRVASKKKVELEPSKLTAFRMHYPVEVMKLLRNLALELGTEPMSLVRNLMHAAMQTAHEPCRQLRPRKRKKVVLRGKYLSGLTGNDTMRLTPALKQCIQYRAIAFGETPHGYVRCWLTDLVAGKLGHIDIQPVRLGQMFDSIEAYVLPVLASPP